MPLFLPVSSKNDAGVTFVAPNVASPPIWFKRNVRDEAMRRKESREKEEKTQGLKPVPVTA